MAVYTHNVSEQDVLNTLPADMSRIGASTHGLTLGQVASFIERGAGQVNNQLVRHGMVPDQLGDNPSQLARDAVIAYAAAQCLDRLGGSEEKIDRRMREWERLLKMLREEPQALGEAQDGNAQSLARSNVNTSCPTAKRFDSSGYGY